MLDPFVLKPSAILTALLLAMHSLAACVVWLTVISPWIKVIFLVLILASLLYQLFNHALSLGKSSWVSFSIAQKRAEISTRGGKEFGGEIMHRTVVTSLCVVLCVQPEGGRLPVCQVVFSDALSVEAFRELRVRLRFS